MPKIRGVKPDYWTDEDIVELSIPARLLFVGLWNFACDNGHLQDKPKQIKMRILPGDDINVSQLLVELEEAGRIMRTEGYIVIPKFAQHQRPDKRYWLTCDRPGCVHPDGDSQRKSRSAHGGGTRGARSAHDVAPVGAHVDGDGDGDGDGDKPARTTRRAKPKTRLPEDFQANETNGKYAADNGLDLAFEVEQFKAHHLSKGSLMADWNQALRTWLGNAVKWRGSDRPQRGGNTNPTDIGGPAWMEARKMPGPLRYDK